MPTQSYVAWRIFVAPRVCDRDGRVWRPAPKLRRIERLLAEGVTDPSLTRT